MKPSWFVEYDLDGSFHFFKSENGDLPSRLEVHGHLIGPYKSFAIAKKEATFALRLCIDELKGGIKDLKNSKEENYE